MERGCHEWYGRCDGGNQVSRFVDDIRQARRLGQVPKCFRSTDVRKACPGWAEPTYKVFLPKHRVGNPGGYSAYFKQHADGSYSLIE